MIVNHDPHTKMSLDHTVSKNKFAETKCSSKRRVWFQIVEIKMKQPPIHALEIEDFQEEIKQNKTYKINQNETK